MPGDFGFREKYRQGVEAFYQKEGADYRNPHEERIWGAVAAVAPKLDISGRILDLACGSGEMGRALRACLGSSLQLENADPYTETSFRRLGGQGVFLPLTFEAVAKGALAPIQYSLVTCSYALHLCPPSLLPMLGWQLSRAAKQLLVLSPLKRPKAVTFWEETFYERVERIHIRLYQPVAGLATAQ